MAKEAPKTQNQIKCSETGRLCVRQHERHNHFFARSNAGDGCSLHIGAPLNHTQSVPVTWRSSHQQQRGRSSCCSQYGSSRAALLWSVVEWVGGGVVRVYRLSQPSAGSFYITNFPSSRVGKPTLWGGCFLSSSCRGCIGMIHQ